MHFSEEKTDHFWSIFFLFFFFFFFVTLTLTLESVSHSFQFEEYIHGIYNDHL